MKAIGTLDDHTSSNGDYVVQGDIVNNMNYFQRKYRDHQLKTAAKVTAKIFIQNPTPDNLRTAQHQIDLLVEHELLESDIAERSKAELARILR